jgi:ribosome-binding factor A
MRFDRTLRISEEIRKIVSHMVQFEIKDPRISEMTSVTRVDTTNDLRFVNIYISVLGTEEEAKETLLALGRAKGYIRKAIGKDIQLRYTPEPVFKLDTSIEHSVRMSQLIEEVKKTHNPDNDLLDEETDKNEPSDD